jgi:taurine dioxygenase
MDIRKMGAPLGAEVLDVDIRDVDGPTWAEIADLFLKYHVLVFRNQELAPDDQMAFAARWGKLVRHPYAGMNDHPEIIELRNPGKEKDVNQHWHSDMTYNSEPPKLTMLYALETPEIGGDTAFSNQILAWEELSHGLKDVLIHQKAEHTAAGLASIYNADPSEAPHAIHPVVRRHDETGDRALYVCRAFTRNFHGWKRQESKALLEYLFEHSTRPEFQVRHQWQPGDLVMWDNRVLLHFAVHDHGDDPRVIHRVQVEGPIPT